jgi:LacI family transcriptional regulator
VRATTWAAGVIAAAHDCGLRVPDDLSVVGFDNSGRSRKLWPGLTMANLPVEEMTAMAVKQLIAALEPAGQRAPAASLVSCDLEIRQSVAPCV